jgi:hypothetical protein
METVTYGETLAFQPLLEIVTLFFVVATMIVPSIDATISLVVVLGSVRLVVSFFNEWSRRTSRGSWLCENGSIYMRVSDYK